MKRTERYRTLSSIQRYGEDLVETVLRFDPQSRVIPLGESKENEEAHRVADANSARLTGQEENLEKGEPLTEARLNEEVEGRTASKRTALRGLVAENKVERLGKGLPTPFGTA